jgi:peptide-methionine (S)-S-oxide reductase
MEIKLDTAIFGGGCFWCTEAVFQQLRGVLSVTSGYAGGQLDNPTYEQVSMGNTGHAEVIKFEYDPEQISFQDLLEVFFATHDPTTLNRQGNDVGTQYRSVIFYESDMQKQEAQKFLQKLNDDKIFEAKVVTTIEPLVKFYPAEDYHQNYFNRNGDKPYCQVIINPKLEKFKKKFASLLV